MRYAVAKEREQSEEMAYRYYITDALMAIAAADLDEDTGKISLRADLNVEKDFKHIWWVGDYNNGKGFVAVKLFNALSSDGFTIQTNDQEKATADFTFTGHYSIYDQDQVPIEFYVYEDALEDEGGDDGGDTGNDEP